MYNAPTRMRVCHPKWDVPSPIAQEAQLSHRLASSDYNGKNQREAAGKTFPAEVCTTAVSTVPIAYSLKKID